MASAVRVSLRLARPKPWRADKTRPNQRNLEKNASGSKNITRSHFTTSFDPRKLQLTSDQLRFLTYFGLQVFANKNDEEQVMVDASELNEKMGMSQTGGIKHNYVKGIRKELELANNNTTTISNVNKR